MEENKSDPHEAIPIFLNSQSIWTGPSETHRLVTGSQTKKIGTQMPEVHGADRVVGPGFKPKTQVRGQGIPMPIPVIAESVSPSHR